MRRYVLILLLLLAVAPANADSYTLNFTSGNAFSGALPAGSSLTASFTDVSPQLVKLVITSNLGPGESLQAQKALYLNFDDKDPAMDVTKLFFTLVPEWSTFAEAAKVQTKEDGFKPGGGGLMDILFTYNSPHPFTTGQVQTYLISTSSGTIQAADFTSFGSTCRKGCSGGSQLAVIHVQGISTPEGGTSSAWVGGSIPLPEPNSRFQLFTDLGLLAAVLGWYWRRKHATA